MNWNWRTGLLAQAQSDYKIYLKLNDFTEPIPQCYCLHFLQMATEKLAKGLMSKGATPPTLTHKAFQRFVQQAHNHESVRNACGFKDNSAEFVRYLRGIQHIAQYIENLVPSGIELPNLEYPWEERQLYKNTIQTTVHVPITYDWSEWDMSLPEIVRFLEFLERCFHAVEQELSDKTN